MFSHTSIMRTLIAFACLLTLSVEGAYIERFTTIDNGGIAFTGNTVGLSKAAGDNNPGQNDSIGAYISVNPNHQVNEYPAGTTLEIASNGSAAVLDLPSGSEVLYAELIWSGSYGWPLDNPLPAPPHDNRVTLTTPQNVTHSIKADKTTAQNDLSPGFSRSGNYVRSANVTSIIQLAGSGTYIAGQIPGTIDKADEEHNAAGWTLAVVYRHPQMYTSRLTLWVGCEQGKESKEFHTVDSILTPSSGVKTGRLFISAIEGDAVRSGDHLLFGSHPNLTFPENALFGENNPIDNFFASQINTLVEFIEDGYGRLIAEGSAKLDTRGSFGDRNHDSHKRKNVAGGRQGYDITSIDVSERIDYDQTALYIQGQTFEGDEDYTISALGLQVQVDAPILLAKRWIDTENDLILDVTDNQKVLFSLTIENCGTREAKTVLVKNLAQKGVKYIPGTFKVNGLQMPDRYIELLPLGDLEINQSVSVEYEAMIDKQALAGRSKLKPSKISYQFKLQDETPINVTSQTNLILN